MPVASETTGWPPGSGFCIPAHIFLDIRVGSVRLIEEFDRMTVSPSARIIDDTGPQKSVYNLAPHLWV